MSAEQARLLYSRSIAIIRESLHIWHDDDLRDWLWLRAKRVVQGIIDLASSDPTPFFWLVHNKNREEYLSTHGANVALLAILTGQRAGLTPVSLRDLGTAGLFHDLGRIGVPAHVLGKGGEFGEGEVQEMGRHPIHGTNLLLGLEATSESLMRLLTVVFEHNIDSNGYPRESWPRGLHLFSRIVAIADAYDAMTTPRSFRPGKTPDAAIRELVQGAGTRYDADLVEVFRSMMGAFPRGTLVRLDTAEFGLVVGLPKNDPARPPVLLLNDGEEDGAASSAPVDLEEKNESGGYLRSIVSTENPDEHGVHVPGFADVVA